VWVDGAERNGLVNCSREHLVLSRRKISFSGCSNCPGIRAELASGSLGLHLWLLVTCRKLHAASCSWEALLRVCGCWCGGLESARWAFGTSTEPAGSARTLSSLDPPLLLSLPPSWGYFPGLLLGIQLGDVPVEK
jgi:hypothetical protein